MGLRLRKIIADAHDEETLGFRKILDYEQRFIETALARNRQPGYHDRGPRPIRPDLPLLTSP